MSARWLGFRSPEGVGRVGSSRFRSPVGARGCHAREDGPRLVSLVRTVEGSEHAMDHPAIPEGVAEALDEAARLWAEAYGPYLRDETYSTSDNFFLWAAEAAWFRTRPPDPPPPPPKVGRKSIPEAVRWAVFKRDGYTCQACGADSPLTIDHRIAWSKGGTDDIFNLRTLCRPCNSRKSDR